TTERFLDAVVAKFKSAAHGTLLSANVAKSLSQGVSSLIRAGAHTLVGGKPGTGAGYCHANTLLRASGQQFLEAPEALQTEMFGNASLAVVAEDLDEACRVVEQLEGKLTACIYSHTGPGEEAAYAQLALRLRSKSTHTACCTAWLNHSTTGAVSQSHVSRVSSTSKSACWACISALSVITVPLTLNSSVPKLSRFVRWKTQLALYRKYVLCEPC